MTSERKSHPYVRIWVADIVQSCQEMNATQFGAHMRMLLHAWDRGYCPSDTSRLLRIVGEITDDMLSEVLERWSLVKLEGVSGKVYVNRRLEHERKVMIEQANARSAAAQKANAIRWGSQTDPSRIRDGSQTDPTPDSRYQIPDDRDQKPAEGSSAPRKARAKPTDSIVWTPDESWQGITDKDRAAWAIAYPAVDIDRDLVKADQYLRGNPAKAHKRKWRAFITRWFDRTQERGGNMGAAAPASPKPRQRDTSHIPTDCHPDDFQFFWDGNFPNVPTLYKRLDGVICSTSTRKPFDC